MPVSREELTDPERPLAMTRPEEHDVADSAGDQLHPSQDEGAHEDFAQLAVGLDERQQVVATDLDDLTDRSCPDLGEPAAARQHGDFARKHPGTERHHKLLAALRPTEDVDATRRDDEETRRLLARLYQHLAPLDLAPAPVRGEAGELRRRQRRIDVLGSLARGWGRARGGGGGHRRLLTSASFNGTAAGSAIILGCSSTPSFASTLVRDPHPQTIPFP